MASTDNSGAFVGDVVFLVAELVVGKALDGFCGGGAGDHLRCGAEQRVAGAAVDVGEAAGASAADARRGGGRGRVDGQRGVADLDADLEVRVCAPGAV
jgi:hypothetical protein